MTLYDQKFGPTVRVPKAEVIVPKAPSAVPPPKPAITAAFVKRRTTLAYTALVTFSFLYYARPEDFIPGIAAIPVGKISGGLALAGLLLSWRRLKGKMPLVIKLVLVLFVQMCLTVPFAFWRGGAFGVVKDQASKAVIVALLVSMIVSSLKELRRLLWVQAASIAVLTTASIGIHAGSVGRMWGLGGAFSNPNDFAINIAINFPLVIAFLLASKGTLKKLLWTVAVLVMIYGVIATYSRSGMIAMMICFIICVWQFGVRGRRPRVVFAAILAIVLGVGFGITTPHYVARLETLVGGNTSWTMDHGSLDARRGLLKDSIRVTMQHPLFGVGPGNFQAYTETWRVTHNTYTELSSEAGIPALVLFLTILLLTFKSLKKVSKTTAYRTDPQIQLFTDGLRAGLGAYVVGAAFASTAYTLFPYFLVAYVAALYKIATFPEPTQDTQPAGASLNARNAQDSYGKQEQPALAGAR